MLACLRLGLPTSYARGADLLPPEVTDPLVDTLVGSLEEKELRRALRTAASALLAEFERSDRSFAERLRPVLVEVGG